MASEIVSSLDEDEAAAGGSGSDWSSKAFPHAEVKLTSLYRIYQLEILQEPQRARACGFGDKVS